MSKSEEVSRNFRSMVEKAERNFARVRDAPLHPYGQAGLPYGHFFHKVFKSYMHLWRYQQENRAGLMESGLQRWEIGEIASRIGQLYFNQYMRTSEARFLLEAYVFYEAIFYRKYFNGSANNREIRFKELRFHARFLMVALILNRVEMVKLLVDRLKELVEESKVNFRETNFKEWKLVVQEIVRFTKADSDVLNIRPLRYTATYDSYPSSFPSVARYHAKRLLKFRDAILTSYHRNEVKFADLSLDTFRMLQCLEWEPSGAFYQKQTVEPRINGVVTEDSLTSGMIDINLFADMTDPNLPPNPKKAVLYRPSVTQLIATISTVCQELPPDHVMLIYISAPGDIAHCRSSETENTGRKSSDWGAKNNHELRNGICENHSITKGVLNHHYENCLVLSPSRNRGSNMLFPGDIIPFTRKPLSLIIDSDNSHSFKVIRGSELGEPVSLFLSPSRPSFKNRSIINDADNGRQFTLFLTAPLLAFCQLVDYNLDNDNLDLLNSIEKILSESFSKWEEILCTCTDLDLAWAQLLCDPFLRRLILRFIFCRGVLALFSTREKSDDHVPECIPELPGIFSPRSEAVKTGIKQLAACLEVSDCFRF